MNSNHQRGAKVWRWGAAGASVWVTAMGSLSLIGYAADVPILTTVVPGLPAMVPLTAASFVAAGVSLWLLRHSSATGARPWIGRALGLLVAALATAIAVEYLVDLDLGLDLLLFADALPSREAAGRPAPHTTAALLLCGLALAFIDADRRGGYRPAFLFGSASAAVALAALLAYAYGVGYVRAVSTSTGMALHTAVGVLVLATGTALARPERSVLSAVTGSGTGAQLARRLIPVLLLLPFGAGLMGVTATRSGLGDPAFAVVVSTVMSVMVVFGLIEHAVRHVDRADQAQRSALAHLRAERDERAEAERRLRAHEEQTSAMIAKASDPFISVDADGLIIEWNEQAETVFGWRRAEVVGTPLAETIVPERYRPAHRDGLRRVVAGGEPRVLDRRVELTALRRDGHEIPVELALWRVTVGGVDSFHGFLHDITERLALQAERERRRVEAEREEYERRLHHSQRLESLGQLAGGVAHDFNNLLAVMGNYADFIATAAAAAGPDGPAEHRPRWEEVGRDVAQVQRAVERATRLTRQLLTFGRGDVIRPEVLSLNEVVSEVEQILRRTIGERIELVTDQDPELPSVYADPGQMEQILINLAVNARDAMPDGGALTIETRAVFFDAGYASTHPGLEPGDYAQMRVSDTGTGMTREVMQRAFEPFFTSKPKGYGTGLGLATVYGIVTHAGGQVQLYSEPGMGTTVSILLPATDRIAERPRTVTRKAAPAGWQTVLLVEDDEAIREVTRRILVRNGFQTLTASDSHHAIEIARDHAGPIHLLLTDVVMPHLLGTEVAAAVRQLRPEIRVLYMSGYALPVLANQGTLEPHAKLVEKPFTEVDLLDRIREVLSLVLTSDAP
jgi:PAS domain S-box-containing protein